MLLARQETFASRNEFSPISGYFLQDIASLLRLVRFQAEQYTFPNPLLDVWQPPRAQRGSRRLIREGIARSIETCGGAQERRCTV